MIRDAICSEIATRASFTDTITFPANKTQILQKLACLILSPNGFYRRFDADVHQCKRHDSDPLLCCDLCLFGLG